jgi:Spy/CpxP family protein refolding chaperone
MSQAHCPQPKEQLMKRLAIALLAAVLGIVTMLALAQPQPLHGGGPLAMLAKLKPQLNLNTSQQQQWDAVIAQSKSAHETARANFAQVTAALQAELAKSEPDFAAVAALSDGVRQQNAALHRQSRDAWLAFYATFTPEQKVVARDAIKAGLDRIAARRSTQHGVAPTD